MPKWDDSLTKNYMSNLTKQQQLDGYINLKKTGLERPFSMGAIPEEFVFRIWYGTFINYFLKINGNNSILFSSRIKRALYSVSPLKCKQNSLLKLIYVIKNSKLLSNR